VAPTVETTGPAAAAKTPIGPRVVLSLIAAITGAAGLIYEYLLATTSSYLIGDSIVRFSITICLMMLMMGAGTFFQRFIPDRLLLVAFIGTEIALCLMGAFAPIANVAAFAYMTDQYDLVQYAFIIGIGLAIGLEIPLAARLNERFEERLKVNLAHIVGMDYIGAAVGGILWVIMLHMLIPITAMSFYVGAANLFVATLAFAYFWRWGMLKKLGKIIGTIALCVVLGSLAAGYTNIGSMTAQANQAMYLDPIALNVTTPYQNIVITNRQNPSDVRLYINGNTQFSSTDEFRYHESMALPALTMMPHKRVLILGGGDGLLLREVEKYKDVQSITLVDLDPEMIRLASTYPLLTQLNHNSFKDARVFATTSGVQKQEQTTPVYANTGERMRHKNGTYSDVTQQIATVHVYTVDAFKFVHARPGLYDVVFIDLPDPNSVELAKLYSQQFYAMVRGVMTPDGVLVVQSGSPFHAREAFVCVGKTIATAGFTTLQYHVDIESFGDWGFTMAFPNRNINPMALVSHRLAGLRTWPVPTQYLVDGNSFMAQLSFGKGTLDGTGIFPSTLENPTILNYYVYSGWKID